MPWERGTLLKERYRLDRQLGASGTRQTWTAQEQDGRTVTLKALYFGPGMSWQNLTLFEREAQTLKSLDHPRIPRYRDFFQLKELEGDYFCLVQDYIPGTSLAERVHAGQRLNESQLEKTAQEILEILDYLHGQAPPVIHRDVKPGNLILGEDGHIYLVDFGSVQAEQTSGRTLTVVGTYGYMAPEQFGGRALPASDLYGLGSTLVFLATGVNPADLIEDGFRIRVPGTMNASAGLQRWIHKLVEPDPNRRFKDARAALAALKHKVTLDSPLNLPSVRAGRLTAQSCDAWLSVEIATRKPALEEVFAFSTCVVLALVASFTTVATFRLPPEDGLFVVGFSTALSLGFWVVLALTMATNLLPMLCRTHIQLDREGFTLVHRLFDTVVHRRVGDLSALSGKQVLGFGLAKPERDWIEGHIRHWLGKTAGITSTSRVPGTIQ